MKTERLSGDVAHTAQLIFRQSEILATAGRQSRIILRKEYQVRYRLERVMDLVIRPVEATLQSVWSEYLR